MTEKSKSIYFRITPQEKAKIESIAKKCGLSVSEYLRKRALGFAPNDVQSSAFYNFSKSIGELLNQELSPKVETAALALFDQMQKQLLLPSRELSAEIIKGMEE